MCVGFFQGGRWGSVELFGAEDLPAKTFQNWNPSQENVTLSSAKKCRHCFSLFHSDTKRQNVAPVGWFNLNKQASTPCQGADSKRQRLFGFNQKCQHFWCDISDSKVFGTCVCLRWREGWSVCRSLFLCTLWICVPLFVVGSGIEGPGEKKDACSPLPLPQHTSLRFASAQAHRLPAVWQRWVTWRNLKGNNGLEWFLSRRFFQKACSQNAQQG